MITGKGDLGKLKGTTSLKICKPGTVVNSDESYSENVASGGVLPLPDVDITNSLNEIIATVPAAKNYEVPDTVARNSEQTILKSMASGFDDEIPDTSHTNTFGNIILWPAGKPFVCEQVIKTYAYTPPTGQTTIYEVGDDAYVQQNILNNLPPGKIRTLANFYNLKSEAGNENIFGHFKRRTGLTGGYRDELTNQYKTATGVATTEATAFPSGYILDHYTGYGWLNIATSAAQIGSGLNWQTMIAAAWNLTYLDYNDWFIPNQPQLNSICNYENYISGITRLLAYPPFATGANSQYPTSTTVNSSTNVSYLDAGRFFSVVGKGTIFTPPPICRKHF